jgi:hypothetical protein
MKSPNLPDLSYSVGGRHSDNLLFTMQFSIPKYKGFKFSHIGYPKMDQYVVSLHALLYKDNHIDKLTPVAAYGGSLLSLIYIPVPEFKESCITENITYYSVSEFKNLPEGTEGYILERDTGRRLCPFVIRKDGGYHTFYFTDCKIDPSLYSEFFVTKLGE